MTKAPLCGNYPLGLRSDQALCLASQRDVTTPSPWLGEVTLDQPAFSSEIILAAISDSGCKFYSLLAILTFSLHILLLLVSFLCPLLLLHLYVLGTSITPPEYNHFRRSRTDRQSELSIRLFTQKFWKWNMQTTLKKWYLVWQNLHAQNALWLHVLRPIVKFLCATNRGLVRGEAGWGSSIWMKGGWCHRYNIWLAGVRRQLLVLAHVIVRKSCNLLVSLAQKRWSCVMLSWLF